MVYPKLKPKAVSKWIGRQYVNDNFDYQDKQHIARVYESMGKKVLSMEQDIPVEVIYQEDDPYESYEDMRNTVRKEGLLRIYSGHNNHEYFTEKENLAFRAVHDWYGHLQYDVNFSAEGEFKKWYHMRPYFQEDENMLLFAEVCGQVGAVHYLKEGFNSPDYQQRAIFPKFSWIELLSKAVFGIPVMRRPTYIAP